MEVTDRLDGVTQVTFQYDISSYCHSHRTLISTMQRAFTLRLLHSLPLSLSLHYVWEQCSYCQMWLRPTPDKRLWRSAFQWGGGSCWHKGRGGWLSSTTMAADWPSKSVEPRARCGADDVPRPDRLTRLVMPTIRDLPPWDFLKRKCVLDIAKNALICCLLSVG